MVIIDYTALEEKTRSHNGVQGTADAAVIFIAAVALLYCRRYAEHHNKYFACFLQVVT